jgi:hypothetical protein
VRPWGGKVVLPVGVRYWSALLDHIGEPIAPAIETVLTATVVLERAKPTLAGCISCPLVTHRATSHATSNPAQNAPSKSSACSGSVNFDGDISKIRFSWVLPAMSSVNIFPI